MSRRFDRQFSVNDRLPYIADTQDNPVELASLEVTVRVTGLFAETTQVLRLYNPNDRVFEGNLCFPLPDGGVVCGYAIDVDGALVDGVVVPKEEARRILEAEIRKGVDPGLVEQVQGNLYRTRIYPLPARGTRTVKIVYVSALEIRGNEAAYHLPLGHAEGLERVSLRVEVAQTPVTPLLVGGLGNLSLHAFDNVWVAEATLGAGAQAEDLLVRLPGLPDHLTAVERFGDEDFFCISSRTTPHEAGGWHPARLAVLWDASGSRESIDRDLTFLDALAAQWAGLTIDVRVVRDVVDPEVRTFGVGPGDTADLHTFLRGLAFDGATNLAAVDFSELPHPRDEAWLVFSDGLATIPGLPAGTAPRVFTITSSARADAALLAHLAERSGGAYVNLLKTSPADAATLLAGWTDALRLENAAGCDAVHVYSQTGRLTVVGRLREAIASVRLVGPGAPADHLSIARDTATTGRNLARAWAGREAQLQKLLGAEAETIVSLGQKYGLVTPGTSLLVLERLDQYLEYDIEPPETLPSMREQFRAFRRATTRDEQQERERQLDHVAALWRQRIEWWETDFSARAPEPPAKMTTHSGDYVGAPPTAAGTPMAMAAPSPAPMREMAMEPDGFGAATDAEYADDDLAFQEEATAAESVSRLSVEAPAPARGGTGSAAASIQIQPWSPDTPYLTRMRAAGSEAAYDAYLAERASYAQSPAFFLDCADFLLRDDQRALGLRVLSNLLELALDDPALLRMYAWRMQQAGELDAAIAAFERVRRQRDDEPQSHRDLALALELRWQRFGEPADAVRAMELLYAVICRTWDRFPEIEIIALMELNRLIHLVDAACIGRPPDIDLRLVRVLDLDVRISMSWDADMTDVDLHVFEPDGGHAYYGRNLSDIGGLVSRDFRQGYGPEEYVLRRAKPGEYTIKTHYFGSHQQTIAGACTVIVHVFTNYARPNEEKQVLTLRLEHASDQVVVGTVKIEGEPAVDWRALFGRISLGMSMDEVVAIAGQPAAIRGSDEMVLVYRPHAGVEVHVVAAPRVNAVRRIMDGASLDLI